MTEQPQLRVSATALSHENGTAQYPGFPAAGGPTAQPVIATQQVVRTEQVTRTSDVTAVPNAPIVPLAARRVSPDATRGQQVSDRTSPVALQTVVPRVATSAQSSIPSTAMEVFQPRDLPENSVGSPEGAHIRTARNSIVSTIDMPIDRHGQTIVVENVRPPTSRELYKELRSVQTHDQQLQPASVRMKKHDAEPPQIPHSSRVASSNVNQESRQRYERVASPVSRVPSVAQRAESSPTIRLTLIELKEAFDKLDASRSGEVSHIEFIKCLRLVCRYHYC
mmetsp:Transcript_42863/g.67208  ORF Transcript_42863/g.67208 Transcript_42863/m.67208 type:complete len:280 (-) Transcript_42863:1542-2381(-)